MNDFTADEIITCAKLSLAVYNVDSDWMVRETGDTVFISIEGTDSPGDWKTNLSFLVRDSDTHDGFKRNGWRIFYQLFCSDVFRNHPKEKKIVLCGHSLGGATATVLLDLLSNVFSNVSLITFGSPRPGGRKLRERLKNLRHLRFVNRSDIVPYTPLWAGGYVHTHDKFHLGVESSIIVDGLEDHKMENYEKAILNLYSVEK